MKAWEDYTRREQLLTLISDAHKVVYGVRYRGNVDHMTDDDLENFLHSLQVESEAQAQLEEELQVRDVASFETLLSQTVSHGALNRRQAIEWLRQADSYYDDRDFEYAYNLPFGYLVKTTCTGVAQ